MSRQTILRCVTAAACIGAATASALAVEPRIELEVITEEPLAGTEARSWTELLAQVGFNSVRMRGSAGEPVEIKPSGASGYRVTAALTSGNQLVLPKGRFRLSDRAALADWVKKLRAGGPDAILIKPVAFGLLPADLTRVHQALTVKVPESTLGKPAREVAKKIAAQLTLKFIADAAAQKALAADETVGDELQGITSGTALAALLRPLGLVMIPEKQAPDLRLRISEAGGVKEFWPVGWPLKSNPSQTLPELFKFLTVEIEQSPLSDAAAAISSRVKAPLLIDHNALAMEKVDFAKKVSLPRASTYYGRALDRLLLQAKLKFDLRLDEADKPFLWITTLKQ